MVMCGQRLPLQRRKPDTFDRNSCDTVSVSKARVVRVNISKSLVSNHW
jgi:hypothetical protein